MESKKGVELSMNTMIIAVMALIVLIVVILILTGQVGKTRTSLNKTSSTYSGEKCEIPGTGRECRSRVKCDEIGGIDYGRLDCIIINDICCSQ